MGLFTSIKELLTLKKSVADKKAELNSVLQEIEDRKKSAIELENEIKLISDEKNKITNSRDTELKNTKKEIEELIERYKQQTEQNLTEYQNSQSQLEALNKEIEYKTYKVSRQTNILKLLRKLQKSLYNLIDAYSEIDVNNLPGLSAEELNNINEIAPSFEVPLHSMDIKSLRNLSKENNKIIENTLKKYEKRYTTKSNKAIYQLMVLALRAELQNILLGMKFTTIDKCRDSFNDMINKYLQIAADGNQSIAPTLNTFIWEIRVLFEQSINIEYEYYAKKEQERAEQQALKEQMRQEAEERKELELQQKQVEKEEAKYKQEIQIAEEQLAECSDDTLIKQLQDKINQLTEQLQEVETQKDEIIKLQNGKAGYVYIISNLGSFGDNRFKIGMTRRIDPMDRVNELGSASVPFKFDVHSFIFSDNAVELEHSLHERLNDRRTNKVNFRKEFFDLSIDELETLVQELDPTAEFNKTMLAIEYRQSMSV